jgi:uncharacterized protein (TIGR02246 family)
MSVTDDIVEIQQLAARYNQAVDSGDAESFAATFTPDGVSVTPQSTTTGHAALAELVHALARTVSGLRHWVNNHVVTVDGDQATATVYVMALLTGDDTKIAVTGRYTDQLQRTPAGWRFTRREFVPD